jgi:hypothetical protein
MDYRTGGPVLDERAGRLRARRRQQERTATEIASDTRDLAWQLIDLLPISDAAVLLGVSKGRITSQRHRLLSSHRAHN